MAGRERLICAAAELTEGGRGVRFETRYQGEPAAAFVVRYAALPRAYLNRCAHVPVELDWQEGEFFDTGRAYLVCATHGALYDPATGACAGGRCHGRTLVALPVIERDGHIYLTDTDHE